MKFDRNYDYRNIFKKRSRIQGHGLPSIELGELAKKVKGMEFFNLGS